MEFPNAAHSTQGIGSTFQLGPFDVNDSRHSASLDVNTDNQSNTYNINQCTNLNGNLNLPLGFEATVLVYPSGSPKNLEQGQLRGSSFVNIQLICELWDQLDCMGSQLDTLNHAFEPINSGLASTLLETALGIPVNTTQSSLCEIKLTPSDNNQSGVMIDGIRLIQQDLIFEDGFETEANKPDF